MQIRRQKQTTETVGGQTRTVFTVETETAPGNDPELGDRFAALLDDDEKRTPPDQMSRADHADAGTTSSPLETDQRETVREHKPQKTATAVEKNENGASEQELQAGEKNLSDLMKERQSWRRRSTENERDLCQQDSEVREAGDDKQEERVTAQHVRQERVRGTLSKRRDDKKDDPKDDDLLDPAAIIGFSGSSVNNTLPADKPAPLEEGAHLQQETIAEIANQIAERISVQAGTGSNSAKVEIRLRENLMRETTINIQRTDQRIDVTIFCDDVGANTDLKGNLSQLKEAIETRTGLSAKIDVRMTADL